VDAVFVNAILSGIQQRNLEASAILSLPPSLPPANVPMFSLCVESLQ
jgi:hypothetical protein